MLEFLPSLGSLLSYGSVSASSKKAINAIGRHKAIVYAYVVLIISLFIGAAVLDLDLSFRGELLPQYILQVVVGGLGVIAAYKALDYGMASIVSPIAKTYVLLVLATSIIFLGEELSAGQIAGAVLIVLSAFVLVLDKRGSLKPEKWMIYLGLAMLCRTYYYTFIKTFVVSMGAYPATVYLELGVVSFVVLFHALRGRDISPPSLKKGGFVALTGALIFAGSVFYSLSVAIIGAALTAAISAGTPIVNTVASYVLLGERLDMRKYAAIVLMVLGLAAIFLL